MSVNKKAVADSFSRAAQQYDQVAHVQKQVGRGLLALLQQHNIQARAGLDIGCGTGWLTLQLKHHAQHLTALDLAPGMLAYAQQIDSDRLIDEFVCADVESLPFPSETFDLIFSSFALQWCDSLETVFNDVWSRLKPGGHFVFSLPVQNTLRELKQSWKKAEATHSHVNTFASVNEVQAALNNAQFLPVSFEERLEYAYYDSVRQLTSELKTLGAHHVTDNPTRSLTGKKTIANMIAAYEEFRNAEGMLPASWHYVLVCAQKKSSL